MRFPLRYGVGVLESGKWVESCGPRVSTRGLSTGPRGSAGLMLDPQPGDDEYTADITRMEQGT